jgi:hypothetical protein
MGFPAPSVTHHLRNPGTEDLVYLMGGEHRDVEVAEFPSIGKVRATARARLPRQVGGDTLVHPSASRAAERRGLTEQQVALSTGRAHHLHAHGAAAFHSRWRLSSRPKRFGHAVGVRGVHRGLRRSGRRCRWRTTTGVFRGPSSDLVDPQPLAASTSESTKRRADPRVVEWLASEDEGSMFLSEIVLGEFENGLSKLPEGKRSSAPSRTRKPSAPSESGSSPSTPGPGPAGVRCRRVRAPR